MNYIWGAMIIIGVVYGTLTGQVEAVSDAVLSSAQEAVTLCITMLGVMALWMGLMEIAREAGLIAAVSRKIQPLIRFLFPRIPQGHPAQEHITMNCVANILGLGWAATPAGLQAMEALAELEEERRKEDTADARKQSEVALGQEQKGAGAQELRQNADSKRARNVTEAQELGQFGVVLGRGRKAADGAGRSAGNRKHSRGIKAVPRGVASNEMCTFLILNISSLQLIPVNVIAYRSQYGSVNPTAIVGPGIVATAVSTAVAIVFCKVMDRRRRA